MKKIALQGKNGVGKYTLVDDEDYPLLSRYRWNFWHGAVVRTYHEHGKIHVWYMHRIIMNPRADKEIDHINGDPLDNRKENLRMASHQQNMWNRKMHKTNSSGYTNIRKILTKNKGERFVAIVPVAGRTTHLGTFSTLEEAVKVYQKAVIKHRQGIARVNLIGN